MSTIINTLLAAVADMPSRLPSDLGAEKAMAAYPQFNLSQWENYHCLTLDKFNSWLPDKAQYCEDYTLKGIQAQSQIISDIIEPCIFPWLNKSSTITQAELAIVQTFVADSCAFYNATGYAAYTGCSAKINKQIYKDIKAGTAPNPYRRKCEYEAYYADKDWVHYCAKSSSSSKKPEPTWKPREGDWEEWQDKWGHNYGTMDDENTNWA